MWLGIFGSFGEKNLAAIKRHKYKKVGESIAEPYLRTWWNASIHLVPRSISANAITLSGLVVLASSSLLMSVFSREFTASVPAFVHFYAAFALFIYQTLDAIDGMQARRLNISSPLGEIFDHGCDAMATFLIMINLGGSTRAGTDLVLFKYAFWCVFLSLYCTHWAHYVTGNFYFTRFNVTEAQLSAILTHIIAGIFSDSIFHIKIYSNVDFFTIICYFVCVVNIFCIPYFLYYIMTNGKGKNGSSVANTSILSPIIPLFFIFVVWLHVENNSNIKLFINHPIEMLLVVGMTIGTISTKMLFCAISETPFPLSDISLILIFMLGISIKLSSPTVEIACFYAVMIIQTIWTIFSFMNISLYLSEKFNIPILGLKKKQTE